jgi:hypothetical protein
MDDSACNGKIPRFIHHRLGLDGELPLPIGQATEAQAVGLGILRTVGIHHIAALAQILHQADTRQGIVMTYVHVELFELVGQLRKVVQQLQQGRFEALLVLCLASKRLFIDAARHLQSFRFLIQVIQ